MSLTQLYRRLLNNYPLIFQSIQTGILMGSGDCIAQLIIEKRTLNKYDFKRTGQFMFMGTFIMGPVLTKWYRYLAIKFGDGKENKTIAIKKVLCDQLLFAPIGCGLFLITINFIQGKSYDMIKYEFDTKYMDILKNNFKLWPAVQIFNFSLVPLQYQVLVVQIAAIVWNVYICWKTHQEI